MNHFKESCGVFGVYGHPDASKLTYLGLYALQHRGQESAGIVSYDGDKTYEYVNMGLVSEVFNEECLNRLRGYLAIGHVRYSTTGPSILRNAQPFLVHHLGKSFAIAHNGNLINAYALRKKLEEEGAIFQSTMDSEIIMHLWLKYLHLGLEEALHKALSQLKGAYSLLLMTDDTLIAARDPFGFRPLCLGRKGDTLFVASETCALDLVEAEYIRDIEPGEILFIDKNGLRSIKMPTSKHAYCVFELIYFSRPDSYIFGKNVYLFRKEQGHQLAKEAFIEGDFVMPLPDSGNYVALGYAEATKMPFEMGMIRNHYVGRTFIQPSSSMRGLSARIKLNPVKALLKGKRIIILEDSIVRGTTSRSRIKALREIGVKEIHLLISCPPHRFPCFYGIDFPSPGELIAASKSIEEIRDFLGLDSLHYLSLEGLLSIGIDPNKFCLACFTGDYPIMPERSFSKRWLER
ncbi:MAG: amidophosphoribosyltransferase [Deltaproteobacteria bacterium]|nr:amidophosphoribosyltransferase [Deltaproteobacteria bacterium]